MNDPELTRVIEQYGGRLEAFVDGQPIRDVKGKSKIDGDALDDHESDDNAGREKAFRLILNLNDLWLAYSLQEGAEEEFADYSVPDTVKETLDLFPISDVMELDLPTSSPSGSSSAGPSRNSIAFSTASSEASPPITASADTLQNDPPEDIHCIVCNDKIRGRAIVVPCSHSYDVDCLVDMFLANITDEASFPPRCCGQRVPINLVEQYFGPDLLVFLNEKITEYSTPARVYCCNKTCSLFLGPRDGEKKAKDCQCGTKTCSSCSEALHPGTPCKLGEAVKKALVLGQSQGWQRCPGCRQLVERFSGCFHMTCRCGTQFCYLCSAVWRTCNCSSEDRGFFGRRNANYLLADEGQEEGQKERPLTRLIKRMMRFKRN